MVTYRVTLLSCGNHIQEIVITSTDFAAFQQVLVAREPMWSRGGIEVVGWTRQYNA